MGEDRKGITAAKETFRGGTLVILMFFLGKEFVKGHELFQKGVTICKPNQETLQD